jgi:hypothetical protein
MTGRLMNSHDFTNANGSWQLPLDNFSSGIYLVVLKQNDITVQQVKLSVIR